MKAILVASCQIIFLFSQTPRTTPTSTSRDDYRPEASAGAASPTTKALAKTKTGRVGAAGGRTGRQPTNVKPLQPYEKRSNT